MRLPITRKSEPARLPAILAAMVVLTATPALAAFPASWNHYEEITIEFGQPVPQNFAVGVTANTAALFSSGQMLANGGDLLIAWDSTGTGNWVEIEHHVRPKTNTTISTSPTTQLWFRVQEPAGISTYPHVGRYRLYSAFPGAVLSARLRNCRNVYRFCDDFVGGGVNPLFWYTHPNYASAFSVSGGILHINGNNFPPNPANQWFGPPVRMTTQNNSGTPIFQVGYVNPFIMETRFRSYNLANDVRPVTVLESLPPNQSDLDEYPVFVAESTAKGGGALAADNIRLGRVLNAAGDPLANSGFVPSLLTWYDAKLTANVLSLTPGQENVLMSIYMDDVFLDDSTDATINPFNQTRTSGTVGITVDPGTEGDIDWTLVRDFVTNQPAPMIDPKITLFARPKPGGTEVYWTHTSAAGITFDVLRGQLSNLSEAGGVVSLGSTSCTENDSVDTTTNPANLDGSMPPAGDGWYYLVRGKTPGGGAGLYGFSTKLSQRLDNSGPGCPI